MEVHLNRTIALAYAITGLAVAAALVAIVGSTTGLFGSEPSPPTESPTTSTPSALVAGAPAASPASPVNAQPVLDPSGAEIVYVDAPATPRRGDDDKGNDDDLDEKGHRGEREDDDD
jgi:hypothetical protein